MAHKFAFLESMDILSSIPQYHTFLFTIIVLLIALWIGRRRFRDLKSDHQDRELQRKLDQWNPEPLILDVKTDHPSLSPKKVSSKIGKYITIDGKSCLNLSTHNYLGLIGNADIESKAISTISKYGVGSCGPRGFYGTVDVHLELEERIAKFMEMEEAVVYSYGFSTIASAIPAFCKRKDIIFVDEKVNFSIQKGLDASRSTIKYFKHNDTKDFLRLLIAQERKDSKNPKNAQKIRKFLVIEGIYMNTGTICPLPDMVSLCRKYKLRLFMDESISFGTMGATGRGLTEYFNIPRHEIDMIMGSLEWAVGSVGGFCVGTSFVIEHHRLSGLGYCFSASLPPLLTTAASVALEIMDNNTEMFSVLKRNCIKIDQKLKEIENLICLSFAESPVKHLYLKEEQQIEKEKVLLRKISDKCFENNLAVIMPAYLGVEKDEPRPSLRICLSTNLKDSDIDFAVKIIKQSAKTIL